jgi:hypothetical protein
MPPAARTRSAASNQPRVTTARTGVVGSLRSMVSSRRAASSPTSAGPRSSGASSTLIPTLMSVGLLVAGIAVVPQLRDRPGPTRPRRPARAGQCARSARLARHGPRPTADRRRRHPLAAILAMAAAAVLAGAGSGDCDRRVGRRCPAAAAWRARRPPRRPRPVVVPAEAKSETPSEAAGRTGSLNGRQAGRRMNWVMELSGRPGWSSCIRWWRSAVAWRASRPGSTPHATRHVRRQLLPIGRQPKRRIRSPNLFDRPSSLGRAPPGLTEITCPRRALITWSSVVTFNKSIFDRSRRLRTSFSVWRRPVGGASVQRHPA